MSQSENYWFQKFQIEQDDRSDDSIVWADQETVPVGVRKPSQAERRSLLKIGVVAIAFNILLIIILIVAVYLSRN